MSDREINIGVEHGDGVGVGNTAQEAIDSLEANPAPLRYMRIADGIWGVQREERQR